MSDVVERIRKMLAMNDAGYGTFVSHEDVGRLLKEYDHVCERNAEMLAELIQAREELVGYEAASSGEDYNNTRLNDVIARAEAAAKPQR